MDLDRERRLRLADAVDAPRRKPRALDALWRAAYRVAFRLQLLYWRVRHPRLEGAYVAVWHGERLLMIRNSYRRKLSMPAGGLERGETPVQAALRELREEVGIESDAQALRYFGEIVDSNGYAEDHAHVFELRCAVEPRPAVDGREVVWAGMLRVEEALERGVVSVVRQYLERIGPTGARSP
jgi:8-oxo-dGTP pyrophosphatase MutT (NUDIX family)